MIFYKLDTLGEVCDRGGGIVQTGPFGSQLHERDYVSEGIPTIMPRDIVDGRINRKSVARITERKADELARHKLKIGAVLLPRRGEINKRAFITEQEEGWLCGTGCIKVEIEGAELLPQFLYYYLDLPTTVKWLEQHAVGSTMLNLSASIVRSLPVILPPLGVQKRIAAILSAYDDLIENNRRRIQLLEQAARLIYQEWFVRLRFPDHERVRVVDRVPEGWKKVMMVDVCQAIGGGTPDTKNPAYWEGGEITWVIPSDITQNNCLILLDSQRKITEAGLQNSSAKLLPPETILMTSRASVGFFGLIDREVCTNQGFIAVVPNSENLRMYLLYNLLSRRDEILLNAKGTTYLEINKATFRRMGVTIPDEKLLEEFHEQVSPLIKQVRLLKRQVEKLKQARDLLLPKLMSGEMAV